MGPVFALLRTAFAASMSALAKIGIENVNSNLAAAPLPSVGL